MSSEFAWQRHLGIYAYRTSLLNRFVRWGPSPLEAVEKLEQLRVLWHAVDIHVERAVRRIPPGIDTEQDLRRTMDLLDDSSP